MKILGWGTTPYDGELIFPALPPGLWELIGTQLVRRHRTFSDAWEVQCLLRNRTNPSNTLTRYVPSSWLPYFIPHTLWRDGELAGDGLAFERILPVDLTIDASSVTDLDVYDGWIITQIKPDGGEKTVPRYTVPPKIMKFAGVSTQRYRLVGVRRGDDPLGVIIPAYALNHFYFCGVSSRVSDALFSGNLEDLYDPDRSHFLDPGRQHFQIAPARNISDSDCWVIARVAATAEGSPERLAFNRFHSSLVRANINNQPALPKGLFPFAGRTNLRVLGRWFEGQDQDGNARRRLYVKRIISCSASWPIDDLTILRDGIEAEAREESDEKPPFYVLKSKPADHMRLLSDRRGNPNRPLLTVDVESAETRFSFLQGKKATIVFSVRDVEGRKGIAIENADPSDVGSTLPGSDPQSDAHPVQMTHISKDAAEAENELPEEQPKTTARSRGTDSFLSVLELLVSYGAQVRPVAIKTEPWNCEGYVFGTFPPMAGSRSWEKLTVPRSDGRTERLAMVADIQVGVAAGALYYIEPRDDEPTGCMMLANDPDLATITERRHFAIVDTIRKLRRVWGIDSKDPKVHHEVMTIPGCFNMEYRRIEHRHLEPSAYADQIFARLSALSDNWTKKSLEP